MVIMMKHDSIFKLNMATAAKKITNWKLDYPNNESVNLKFTNNITLGEGSTRYYEHSDSVDISIGISPLSTSFFDRYIPLHDSDFVLMGVTFFHEMAHYQDHILENTDVDVMVSDISVQHNKDYYYSMHHLLPHEIDAEYNGVMSMWSALESEWPEHADRLMFDYLDYRTMGSDHVQKLYMIERPDEGFQSKQQVKDLFDEAYEKSLVDKRKLPGTFLVSDDDVPRLITTDDGHGVSMAYVPVYLKLLKAETGAVTDRMIASLVAHIHPELQSMYERLDFDKLQPEEVFKMEMPETSDESRARLGYEGSFTSSVDHITKLRTDEQHL